MPSEMPSKCYVFNVQEEEKTLPRINAKLLILSVSWLTIW
jgi:hypothetical protein